MEILGLIFGLLEMSGDFGSDLWPAGDCGDLGSDLWPDYSRVYLVPHYRQSITNISLNKWKLWRIVL